MLKKWRRRNKLTLVQAAKVIGLKAQSGLFYIEHGITFPMPEAIAKIEGATGGEITVVDHWRAWCAAHPQQLSEFRAAGRSAAKEHRSPAKPKSKRRA
jgi:transcriptional regulator with XRE-family HTH domain